jgi:methionyl-tRNA formyltransferase
VLAPERLRRDTSEALAALDADVGVLAASGHILPEHLLATFPRGVLNVHASLLPRHRGASPVAAAILAGDAQAGASIMLVVRELDAGPVVSSVATSIQPSDTTGSLTARIAEVGAAELIRVLPGWVHGELQATPQDAERTTYAPKLTKADGELDWRESADLLWRRTRAYQPWPIATTVHNGEAFAIHEAWPIDMQLEEPVGTVCRGGGAALASDGRAMPALVACGAGSLALLRVQRPGRRVLGIEEYLRGDAGFIGARLGGPTG